MKTKKNYLKVLVLFSFFLFSCSSDDTIIENETIENNLKNRPIDELTDHDPSDGGSSSGNCNNTSYFSGNCNTSGTFSGSLILEDCKKINITSSYNLHTLSGLNITLPANTTSYTLSTSYSFVNPPAWFYNSAENSFNIGLHIKKTVVTYYYPQGSSSVVASPTYFYYYKTIRVNTCARTMSM